MVGATKPGKAKGSPYKGNNRLKPSTSDVDSDEDVLEAVEENKPSGVAQVVTDVRHLPRRSIELSAYGKEAQSTPKRSPSRRAKRSASSTKSPYFEHDSDAAMSSELSDVDDEAPSKKKRRTPAKSGKTGADPTSSAKRRRVTKAS